jgi:hypothetical protein
MDFQSDPKKELQVSGWLRVAAVALACLEGEDFSVTGCSDLDAGAEQQQERIGLDALFEGGPAR